METISAFFWLFMLVSIVGAIKMFCGDRNGLGVLLTFIGILGMVTTILLNYLYSMKPISY